MNRTIAIIFWCCLFLFTFTHHGNIGSLFIVATVANELSNREFMQKSPYRMDWEYIEMLIGDYHIGGLIFLGKSTKAQLEHAINHFQGISEQPLLIGIDAEWGLAMRCYDVEAFPKACILGTMNNHEVYQVAYRIGSECKQIGIHINFAPVADVNTNPDNPVIGPRSFGAHSGLVAEKAFWFARGLRSSGILACAKHFPGHGNTNIDSHLNLPTIHGNLLQLYQTELVPFMGLISDSIPMVMTGHLFVPALDEEHPASLSATCINFLRKVLQFSSTIITDGLGMESVRTRYQKPGELELHALLAGNNLLLCPLHVPEAVALIVQKLAHNPTFAGHVTESLQKIEHIKNAFRIS